MRCLDALILLPVLAIVPLIIKNKFFQVPHIYLQEKFLVLHLIPVHLILLSMIFAQMFLLKRYEVILLQDERHAYKHNIHISITRNSTRTMGYSIIKCFYMLHMDVVFSKLLEKCRDGYMAGHFGIYKTLELVSHSFQWPQLHDFVRDYAHTCDTCCHTKIPRHRPYCLLQPLLIPKRPWQSISLDFIIDLPCSKGFDVILIAVDRFTKMAHFLALS